MTSSQEPLGQFQPNLVDKFVMISYRFLDIWYEASLGHGDSKFVQMKYIGPCMA